MRVHKLWTDTDVNELKTYIKFKGWKTLTQIDNEEMSFPTLHHKLKDPRTNRALHEKLKKVLVEMYPEAKLPIFSMNPNEEQAAKNQVWKLFLHDNQTEEQILERVLKRYEHVSIKDIKDIIKERLEAARTEFSSRATINKKPTLAQLQLFYKLKDKQDLLSKSALRNLLKTGRPHG